MMKKITQLLTLAIIACNGIPAIAMETSSNKNIHLMIVPGQNGLGGQNIDTVLPYFADKAHLKHKVKTPQIIIDFGQNRCTSYLQQEMAVLKNNDKVIIHASSQGTATALNYVAKNPNQINAIILEAVMLSGNSAIFHNIKTEKPNITSLPGSYYWLPYAAKFAFPFYSPAGNQPIFNADKLSTNLPIIILHHTEDTQLSYQDAQALYAFLKHTKKNDNVYLMSKDSEYAEHVLLLESTKDQHNIQKINAINTILRKHNLLPNDKELQQTNVTQYSAQEKNYQPEIKQEWLDHFEAILNKETKIWYIDWGVKTAFYSLLAYTIYKTGMTEKFINQLRNV